jgi:hypothetical protein
MEQISVKPVTNPFIHYGILGLIFFAALLTIVAHVLMEIPNNGMMRGMQMSAMNESAGTVIPSKSCATIGPTHIISIEHDAFVPDNLTVNRCDRVEFLNKDHALYLPHFGDHPHDITYAGFPDKVLAYNQSETFVAHTSGILKFHDHLRDKAEGVLTINN